MLRALAAALALCLSAVGAGAGESIRQYLTETATGADEIVAGLKERLPRSVVLIEEEGGASLIFAGATTPVPLARFLTAAFPELDPGVIAPGRTVSLTLGVYGAGGATEMSLMVMARFPDPGGAPLDGAAVILDGTGPGACQGQVVMQHPKPPRDLGPVYRGHLEAEGFSFPDANPDETSFFIGHRPDCDLALYLESHRGTSLVVIRYLED